tara:strand:- start:919 stop:1806 length:888 start_codon:yes stop_codon:yes gene_type:complete
MEPERFSKNRKLDRAVAKEEFHKFNPRDLRGAAANRINRLAPAAPPMPTVQPMPPRPPEGNYVQQPRYNYVHGDAEYFMDAFDNVSRSANISPLRKTGSFQQHYYAQGQAQAIKDAGLTKEAKAGKLKKLLALTGAGGAGVGAGLGVNRLRLANLEAGIAANEAQAAQLAEMAQGKAFIKGLRERAAEAAEMRAANKFVDDLTGRASSLAERASDAYTRGLEAASGLASGASQMGQRASSGLEELLAAARLPAQELPAFLRGPQGMEAFLGGAPAAPRSLSGFTAENIADMATKL